METKSWRRGNGAASQIIEKKIMRPHYEMHAAEYGFGFKVLSPRTLPIALTCLP